MILVTGGTGFLGHELVGRLLARQVEEEICLLVRPSATQSAHERVREIFTSTLGESFFNQCSDRLHVVSGDTGEEYFGLGSSEFDALASRIDTIYHGAADTTLDAPLALLRERNVGGTTRVLQFAERATELRCEPIRFFHISTAYVAGDTERTVVPGEIGNSFKNPYEQSKAESERMLLAAPDSIQTCVFRPSVIVGDSVTGQTRSFNVIYVPARLLLNGLFKALPAFPNVPFDIVPVDFVADAMEALGRREQSRQGCYHLTVGVGRESSPLEILELIFSTYSKYRKSGWKRLLMPPLVSPEKIANAVMTSHWGRFGVKTFERMLHNTRFDVIKRTAPFVPYMMRNPQFDSSTTTEDLRELLKQPPLFTNYAESVFRYCLDTNWGRREWTNPANLSHWMSRPELIVPATNAEYTEPNITIPGLKIPGLTFRP